MRENKTTKMQQSSHHPTNVVWPAKRNTEICQDKDLKKKINIWTSQQKYSHYTQPMHNILNLQEWMHPFISLVIKY